MDFVKVVGKTYVYLDGNGKYSFGYFNPFITGFGLQEKLATHRHGPILKNEYTLQYISEGAGFYTVNGKTYNLKAGDMFYLPKNVPVLYYAKKDNPYKYYWVAFDGSGIESFVKNLGFSVDNPVINYADDRITKILENIGDLIMLNTDVSFMEATGNIFKFFAILLSKSQMEKQIKPYNLHVDKAVSYIKNYYNDGDLNVTSLAKAVGLKRNYFSTIFSEIVGVPPVEYLMTYRINQAKKFLELGFSVTDTAFNTGFNSTANFSYQFKRIEEISPVKYRKKFCKNKG
jgi:AraC-like DNA-binding protein